MAIVSAGVFQPLSAQSAPSVVQDGATIDGVLAALYATVTRTPEQRFDWPRLRALFLPNALLVPSAAQARNTTPIHTVESFIQWIDSGWASVIGTPQDRGFFEKQIGTTTHVYGDVAIVFSAYEKGFLTDRQVIGRGINALQLVKRDGRWWIVSISWDEEPTAGPIPAAFLQ
jgi:hypothetical protein